MARAPGAAAAGRAGCGGAAAAAGGDGGGGGVGAGEGVGGAAGGGRRDPFPSGAGGPKGSRFTISLIYFLKIVFVSLYIKVLRRYVYVILQRFLSPCRVTTALLLIGIIRFFVDYLNFILF